jgi:hypothetical protein
MLITLSAFDKRKRKERDKKEKGGARGERGEKHLRAGPDSWIRWISLDLDLDLYLYILGRRVTGTLRG